jgi:hypothetical protein
MAQSQSILPFVRGTPEEIANSLGITQFSGASNWFQIIGGITVQGGLLILSSVPQTILLNAPYEKQVLGIFIQHVGPTAQPADIDNITLSQFNISTGTIGEIYYWFSVGL